jgi:hypothetical protein
MSLIPDELFNDYYTVVDELINNNFIGKDCTVYYPPTRTECPNCTVVKLASGSSNQYKTGGPVPFTVGMCPYCAGEGYQETHPTDSIRLRIYWNKRDWAKVAPQLQVPDAQAMTIGFLADMDKCLRSQYIRLVDEQGHLMIYRFTLAGEPSPHGFGKSRYFIAYWKRDN